MWVVIAIRVVSALVAAAVMHRRGHDAAPVVLHGDPAWVLPAYADGHGHELMVAGSGPAGTRRRSPAGTTRWLKARTSVPVLAGLPVR